MPNKIEIPIKLIFDEDGLVIGVEFESTESELNHAEVLGKSGKIEIPVKPIFDEDGLVIGVKFESEGSELAHYGVMGQKWGIRNDEIGADLKERANRLTMVRNKRTISDEDLAKTVKRLEMEKKLSDLTTNDLAPGRKAVRDRMGKFMATAFGAAAGVLGAALIKELLKKAGISD